MPSSATTKLYSRDEVLMNLILWRHPFDVVSIMYTFMLQCMGHTKECIQYLMMAKLVLILPSLIIQICLKHEINLSSIDTKTWLMEPFAGTTVRSMSARMDQLLLDSQEQFTSQSAGTTMTMQGSGKKGKIKNIKANSSTNPTIWINTHNPTTVVRWYVRSVWDKVD